MKHPYKKSKLHCNSFVFVLKLIELFVDKRTYHKGDCYVS